DIHVEQLLLEREPVAAALEAPTGDPRQRVAHPLGAFLHVLVVDGGGVVVQAPVLAHVVGQRGVVRVVLVLEALAPLVEVLRRHVTVLDGGGEVLGAGGWRCGTGIRPSAVAPAARDAGMGNTVHCASAGPARSDGA
ncbi:MAG: hypothetical protein ACK56I_03190, partial [bacterium]